MTMSRRRAHSMQLRPTAARAAAALASAATRAAVRAMASRSSDPSTKPHENLAGGVKDSLPLTTQRDFQEYYRKNSRKRLTRKQRAKRQRRKKFARAVKSVITRPLGSYQFVKANVGNSAWLINAAVAKGFLLGNCQTGGAAQTSLSDATDNFFANNASLKNMASINLCTMTLELSILSKSTNTQVVDLDIYTVECIRDTAVTFTSNELSSFYDTYLGYSNTNTGVIPVTDAGVAVARAATTLQSNARGWTPWNCTLVSPIWKVVKKEKVLLTPGGTTHVQLHKKFKVPKRIPMRKITENGYLKGVTTAYIIQAFSLWDGTSQPAGTIYYNTEYTYTFKYQPNNEDTVKAL